MKNRDSRKDKRAEKSTEIAGKRPFHRLDKLEKIRRHEVDPPAPRLRPAGENYSSEHFQK